MDKDLYGNKEYSPSDLREMDNQEVIDLGYCPRCSNEGFKVKMFQGGYGPKCPRCGWESHGAKGG